MPRNYSDGDRIPKASAAARVFHGERRSLRERFGGLRNIPLFLKLVWQTSPSMMATQSLLRFVRALLPVATLYVGKLIIDEVVLLAKTPHPADDVGEWLAQGWLNRILWLLALEFGLAVMSDVLGRTLSLLDALLSDRFSTATSLRLMEHAASLDLEDFEDSELQD
ncbi:MAG: ABC transporter ATP-binding protein, partial [Betaproteobacteria bacterium]